MISSGKRPSAQSRAWPLRWLRRLLKLALLLALLSILPVAALRWIDPPGSSFIWQRQLEAARAGNDGFRLHRNWASYDDISSWLGLAVIAAEDQRFITHHGFDTAQIRTVLSDPAGPRRGASTISQQLAKNLFLWSGRGRLSRWSRKALEAWFTAWLEVCLPKRRILELYLNLAEFGDGVYGAQAAARYYFAKPASGLNQREAALLAALLPSPRRYRIRPPTPFMNQRVEWITQQGRQLGGPELVVNL